MNCIFSLNPPTPLVSLESIKSHTILDLMLDTTTHSPSGTWQEHDRRTNTALFGVIDANANELFITDNFTAQSVTVDSTDFCNSTGIGVVYDLGCILS